jgi:uncharacterized protein (UPF0332 family)
MLQDENRNDLVKLRFQKAKETFAEIENHVQHGYWRTAANRLYYTCFYAVSALLIKNRIKAHTHSGVINQFGLNFVKTGFFSQQEGRFFKNLFELRQDGDYDDWITITEEDIIPLIEPVKDFIDKIEHLIFDVEHWDLFFKDRKT